MEKVYDEKKACCGCGACSKLCPKNAIEMKEDETGYVYPVINQEKCIDCGLCKRSCPFTKKNTPNTYNKTYALKNKNTKERLSSSSGGFFIELAKYFLNKNGVVYGVIFDEEFKVVHTGTDKVNTLEKMKGSKYVQSQSYKEFENVKKDLENNKLVLFTGTPCQVKGLKTYLKKEYSNLFTCDNICHGVGSPKIFCEYIEEKKYKTKADKISFRSKNKNGDHNFKIHFKNGKEKVKLPYYDEYYKLFTDDLCIRQSCLNCNFANIDRNSDFTMGDFWGIEEAVPDFYDEKGVSIVLFNTERANKIFEELKEKFFFEEVELSKSLQPNLKHPTIMPNNYNEFWEEYCTHGYKFIAKKYGSLTIKEKLKRKIIRLVRRIKK